MKPVRLIPGLCAAAALLASVRSPCAVAQSGSLSTPTETTVEKLVALPRPNIPPVGVAPIENGKLWTVEADVVQFQYQHQLQHEGDKNVLVLQGIVMVLQGASGQTMVAEIPSPESTDIPPRWRTQVDVLYSQFAQMIGLGKVGVAPTRTRKHARLTGIASFKPLGMETGMARNGITLSVVTELRVFDAPLH